MPLLLHIVANIAAAWVAGSLIGLERSYDGRVAGFRTHGIVALATATTISIAAAPRLLPGAWPDVAGWLDPIPLPQGVMTGVGFLGAGVIFKEGVSVQGLTTAASIYATAAIGLVMGLGLFWPGVFATAAVMCALTVLGKIEFLMPSRVFALGVFRFEAQAAPSRARLIEMLGGHAISFSDISYRLTHDGHRFEFQGSLMTSRREGFDTLAGRLRETPGLIEFELLRISK